MKSHNEKHPHEHESEADQDTPVPAADGGAPETEASPENAHAAQQATGASASPSSEVAKLRQELEDAKVQIDQLRRHAAEMDNSRKRMLRDRERELADKQISILKGLLPIVDNFERAQASLMKATDPEAVKAGTQQIFQIFVDYLKRVGVSAIPAVGEKYDPQLHEAVMQVASAEHDEGVISSELERGYNLGDRVLRHSKVVVSTGPAVESGAGERGDGASEPS